MALDEILQTLLDDEQSHQKSHFRFVIGWFRSPAFQGQGEKSLSFRYLP